MKTIRIKVTDARDIRSVLQALDRGQLSPDITREARRLLPSLAEPRAAPQKPSIASVEHHEDVRGRQDAALRAETARVRERCVQRALRFGWVGELCGRPLPRNPDEAQMCHLDGGSGKRRQQQSVRNCLMEHHECHQGPLGFDKKPLAWLPDVKRWAARHDYLVPERFRKLEALRGAEEVR